MIVLLMLALICFVDDCFDDFVDEVERLERQLEEDDSRLRKLEEEKNLSAQESSLLKAQQDEFMRQQRMSMDRLKDMERELTTKDDLVSHTLTTQSPGHTVPLLHSRLVTNTWSHNHTYSHTLTNSHSHSHPFSQSYR